MRSLFAKKIWEMVDIPSVSTKYERAKHWHGRWQTSNNRLLMHLFRVGKISKNLNHGKFLHWHIVNHWSPMHFRHRQVSRGLIREHLFKHIIDRRSLILFRHRQGRTYLLKFLSNKNPRFQITFLNEEANLKHHMSSPHRHFIRPSFIPSHLRFPRVIVTLPSHYFHINTVWKYGSVLEFFPRDINELCLNKSIDSRSTC
jgi:hypothetical protein